MEGKNQVEVLSINGEKYVIGKSLANAAGIAPGNSANWIRHQIKKRKLVCGTDYNDFGDGVLFSTESAAVIFAQANKIVETGPRVSARASRKLDEYGLPILPPTERRGVLINPYRFD